MATFTPKPQPSVYEVIRHAQVKAFPGGFAGSEVASLCIVSAAPLEPAARDALVASAKALGYREQQLAFVTLAGADTEGVAAVPAASAVPDSGIATAAAATPTAIPTSAAPDPTAADSAVTNPANSAVEPAQLMSIIEALDPLCVVLADHESVAAASRGYNCPLSLETKEQLLGRPCRCFEDFATLLTSEEGKRRAWSVLKTLPRA